MMQSETTVATTNASRYLQQLCKHFRHKITVEFDATEAHADFPWGACDMQASDEALTIQCRAEDPAALARLEYVVGDHLTRFAWKEGLTVDWRRSPPDC